MTITDHRARVCRDLPPAQIIVEETRETPDTGPVTTTKWAVIVAAAFAVRSMIVRRRRKG